MRKYRVKQYTEVASFPDLPTSSSLSLVVCISGREGLVHFTRTTLIICLPM